MTTRSKRTSLQGRETVSRMSEHIRQLLNNLTASNSMPADWIEHVPVKVARGRFVNRHCVMMMTVMTTKRHRGRRRQKRDAIATQRRQINVNTVISTISNISILTSIISSSFSSSWVAQSSQ